MAFEYAFVWVGSENGRPWGSKADGFIQAPHLDQTDLGIDLTGIIIATGTGEETLALATVLVAGAHVGDQLRLGNAAAPLAGYAKVIANDASSITVTWATAASPATVSGYLVKRKSSTPDDDFDLYPQVRVLVPFQPEGPDLAADVNAAIAYPANADLTNSIPPDFILPAGITTWEDWGLFLDFTFLEGICGFGISEATDSRTSPATHAATGTPDATSLDFLNAIPVGLLDGGFLRVVDGGTAGNPVSWARITTQDATSLNFVAYEKGIAPVGAVGSITYEAWVPHYNNSPHAYTPSLGFRYPTNDMMPAAFGDGRIKNLPRAISTSSYGDRFGAMLEFGYRMSEKLGQRVNMVYLAANNTTLLDRGLPNVGDSFLGTLGWWDHLLMSDWSQTKTGGLVDRIKKMIDTMAPAALLAEGSTDDLRYMGIVIDMGDVDSTFTAGQEEFAPNLTNLIFRLRDIINDASLSPYATAAKIPVVTPLLTNEPFELAPNDENMLINSALREVTASDGFGDHFSTEDSPKLSGDTSHFNGKGEALNGNLAALSMGPLVDYALGFGSPIVEDTRQAETDICNLALSHVGELELTSLQTDTGRIADLCRTFYPRARDSLLQAHQWGFAMRRICMVKASAVPDAYLFAYVVPPELVNAVAVLPEAALDDYATSFAARGVSRWERNLSSAANTRFVPAKFEIESVSAGHKVLYTNADNAVLRYVSKVVDARRYPDMFIDALGYRVAALLVGALIKGRQGAEASQRMTRLAEHHQGIAANSDSEQRTTRVDHQAPWIRAR